MSVTEEKPATRKRRATGLKLDLACGKRPTPGFQGVDLVPGEGVDHVVDLFQFPWPFEDRSVREVVSQNFLEHIPHYRPEWNGVDGFWMFFNELHRICQKNAICTFVVPYAKADRAFWDPTHVRFIHEMNFYYLERDWLVREGLDQYPITANFQVVNIQGHNVPEVIQNRNQELQDQARAWYWNIVTDLTVQLKAIK